eukprot:scaffold237152_cov20-Prasinocladus_malaysianus.AAC.1
MDGWNPYTSISAGMSVRRGDGAPPRLGPSGRRPHRPQPPGPVSPHRRDAGGHDDGLAGGQRRKPGALPARQHLHTLFVMVTNCHNYRKGKCADLANIRKQKGHLEIKMDSQNRGPTIHGKPSH